MESFSWKRKSKVTKISKVFVGDSDFDDTIDHLKITKKPKLVFEDSKVKAERLKNEGVIFATEERWWTAIGRWNASTTIIDDDHTVHEMLAQAYMQVGEVFPALKAAQEAVSLSPLWWVGHQTLGRTQLGLGEVSLAVKSFSHAIRLKPDEDDLRNNDFQWAATLIKKHDEIKLDKEKKEEADKEDGFTLKEIPENELESFTSVPKESTKDTCVPSQEVTKLVSKRFMSRVLKRIPNLSNTPEITVPEQKTASDIDVSNKSMVKFRLKE